MAPKSIESFDSWRQALFFPNQKTREDGQKNGANNITFGMNYNALVVDMSTIAGNDLELTCVSLVKEFIALNNNVNDDNDGSTIKAFAGA